MEMGQDTITHISISSPTPEQLSVGFWGWSYDELIDEDSHNLE